ncbi:sugar phosphate isomerase/epimerase family protein [Paenibacillus soyae]|uniref:Sugar phosphate isomerase/epimerase n=1 Tax=Paenibacillus soyae TaxID=2969249 RepID=A0A9X2MUK2_9BACL|nr:sugar phosphate isomerase/epimerase family protein [Paenibacillus soyae]MCR2807144.1 sugar phosphate isomerase/epimerase [Paenibacillus soyae]
MRMSLCTISFRHQLVSFAAIVDYMKKERFDGVEMWGVHAMGMYEQDRRASEERLSELEDAGMSVSMLSDYLDIGSEEAFASAERKCDKLIRLAEWLGTRRIRTFAGGVSSAAIESAERELYTERLRKLCRRCEGHGMQLVVETHPGTLADSLDSTLTLLSDIGGHRLKLNFDVLHVWEFGGDLMQTLHVLEPWIEHFHFKNIASPSRVSLFEPGNIYSASGDRDGMVPLAQGFLDYRKVAEEAARIDCFASLEWFGPSPFEALSVDVAWLRKLSWSFAP